MTEESYYNKRFCASELEGMNISFVLLSSAVQAEAILSAKEQIINFFILYSVDGFGKTEH
jgi:hypothetical protein